MRYPKLNTELEPDEGRGSFRGLDHAGQGYAMAEVCRQ
jgi:hypothetical protein